VLGLGRGDARLIWVGSYCALRGSETVGRKSQGGSVEARQDARICSAAREVCCGRENRLIVRTKAGSAPATTASRATGPGIAPARFAALQDEDRREEKDASGSEGSQDDGGWSVECKLTLR
jgi:hypothetical protein